MHAAEFNWSQLALLPDHEGFAGMYAGVSHEALIIAGGANFPDKRPWEGGTKIWYEDVWLLAKPDGAWQKIGKLPQPLGYGVSITFNDEVICIGGSNATGHHAECLALRWQNEKLTTRTLPSLPVPCANLSGALVGTNLYVAGGIDKPDAVTALHTFWSLDLSKSEATWKALEPWPGKERMLAIAGSDDRSFYLFSGAALHKDEDGKPVREWLKDAYRYTPDKGWERLPDLPRVAVAAPSPAMLISPHELLIASGDDGSKLGFKPETEHPGFPRDTLLFDTVTNAWHQAEPVPFSRATAPTTEWQGDFIIPNGEARPGYRTNEVWRLEHR